MTEQSLRAWIASLACAALAACVSSGGYKPVEFGSTEKGAEETAPLGGASLELRRDNMARMYKDLAQFRISLDNAERRGDRTTKVALDHFVDAYIGMHLDPALAGEWQSRHPELWGVDADLRLAKAQVLKRMYERSRANAVLEEIEIRYAGRQDMLVHYPPGSQTALGKAVQMIRDGD